MEKREYIKIGNATDLIDSKDRRIYRALEILPGALAWGTLIGVVFLSWVWPVGTAFFIITFDIYWLFKTVFLSMHLRSSFSIIRRVMKVNWLEELPKTDGQCDLNWEDVYHLVILPMYKESYEIAAGSFDSLLGVNYPKNKMIVVLAIEERGGRAAAEVAKKITVKYGDKFFKFLVTNHPADIAGELAGKGSNETWAGRRVKEEIIDKLGISYENILVSVFDADTRVYAEYFSRLTYVF